MRKVIALAAFASTALVFVATLPAGAADLATLSSSNTRPGVALFEGRPINLAEGWGEARACMVWRLADTVECFRSELLMNQRENEILAKLGLSSSSSSTSGWGCSSALRLYEHANFGGRQLAFWDAGYWQNLPDWGFNDALSSYKTGSCRSYMAEHIWGSGSWYSGDTSPYKWNYYVGSYWNDRMSSIYNG